MKDERYCIVTAGKKAENVYKRMKERINIVAFADNDAKKWKNKIGDTEVNSFREIAARYLERQIDSFIIPGDMPTALMNNLISQMLLLNIKDEDIYLSMLGDDIDKEISLKRYNDVNSLNYVEAAIVEHCNLNCKSCSHFSPLVKRKEYDIKFFEKDVCELRKRIDKITVFRILGGEPLLNNILSDYLIVVKERFPDSDLRIVTNGLLIPQMDRQLIDIILKLNITIDISVYPAVFPKLENILKFLAEQNIRYNLQFIRKFNKIIDLKGKEFPFENKKDFLRCGCTNIYEGKMSICPVVMFINRLNEAFDIELSQDGLIDLYDKNLSGKKLVQLLEKSVPLCRNCGVFWQNPNEGEIWEALCGRKPKLEDWLIRK